MRLLFAEYTLTERLSAVEMHHNIRVRDFRNNYIPLVCKTAMITSCCSCSVERDELGGIVFDCDLFNNVFVGGANAVYFTAACLDMYACGSDAAF